MPTYHNMSPADFRSKLKNGDYDNLTGAKRAIGKMKQWGDKEKDSARTYATKHFGDAPAPAKKAAKKAVAKRATKKAAPKAAAKGKRVAKKKAAKKVAAAPAAEKMAAAPTPKKAASKRTASKRGSGGQAATSAGAGSSRGALADTLGLYQEGVGTYKVAADTLRNCASEDFSVTEGLKLCGMGILKLLPALDRDFVAPLTAEEQRGANLFREAGTVTTAMQEHQNRAVVAPVATPAPAEPEVPMAVSPAQAAPVAPQAPITPPAAPSNGATPVVAPPTFPQAAAGGVVPPRA